MQSEEHCHTNSSNCSSTSNTSITTTNHIKKKRVVRACSSCRIKKTKCDGKKPCNRCLIDNKICVFTEKKKIKEKNHPQGYIELLETRLDILSKSFENLIELSRPYLPVIDNIIKDQTIPYEENEDSSSEDDIKDYDVIPINKVVNYLIEEKGLLNNLPIEWEEGANIAAKFNNKNKSSSSKLFADHKTENLANDSNNSPNLKPTSSNTKRNKKIKEESTSPIFDQSSFSNNFNNYLQNSNGKYSICSNDPTLSDVESDSPNRNPESISPPFILDSQQGYHYHGSLNNVPTAASLFSNNGSTSISKNSSMTSLSNKYENHSISVSTNSTSISQPNSANSANSPPQSIFTYNPKSIPTIRRSSSTSLSQNQMKGTKSVSNNNHVHKPIHANHNRMNSIELKKRHNSNEELISPENSTSNTILNQPNSSSSIITTNIPNNDFNGFNQFDNDDQNILLNNGLINQFDVNNNSNTLIKSEFNNGGYNLGNANNFDVLIGNYDPFMNSNSPFLERF
ncbi:FCR1 [Candida jiufengensis]|uniref:FCR1 n=1 Tax=Candida jiufengensis TaxID=497108 RepID=UPI0022247FD5|nr:FCR1 [Candida jiufengensis]KAI5952591.1 FCR1 [Candida jiufengensis]